MFEIQALFQRVKGSFQSTPFKSAIVKNIVVATQTTIKNVINKLVNVRAPLWCKCEKFINENIPSIEI